MQYVDILCLLHPTRHSTPMLARHYVAACWCVNNVFITPHLMPVFLFQWIIITECYRQAIFTNYTPASMIVKSWTMIVISRPNCWGMIKPNIFKTNDCFISVVGNTGSTPYLLSFISGWTPLSKFYVAIVDFVTCCDKSFKNVYP